MGTPDKHAVALQLDEQRKHLESERDKFTEATIKLGQEKAALEVGRCAGGNATLECIDIL